MSDDRWRCFVAVPLGDALRRNLAAAVDGWRLRPDLAGLRWADPDSWHVTLAFLGLVDASAVPDLEARLAEAAGRHAPIKLSTGGVGGFPSAARARVAWYGVSDPDGALRALANDVRRAAAVDGGAFRGHVTLARARHGSVHLREWLGDAGAPAGELVVERVDLMRSLLGRGPAQYELLESMAVGAGARV